MKKITFIINLSILFFLISVPLVYPAFDLKVSPYEGGYELKFGKVDLGFPQINKEVVVRITSDLGKSYRVIQSLLEPLTNQKGDIIPSNHLFVYGIRGSNRYGNLAVEQEVPVSLGRTILYTSSSEGLSDTFTLVYSLRGPLAVPQGFYRGRIAFSLESAESGQLPVTVILNVLVEVAEAENIKIASSTGTKTIFLSAKSVEKSMASVSFSITYPLGGIFRIYQLITEPLLSASGETLNLQNIDFYTSTTRTGLGQSNPMPLSLKEQLLYTSDPKGNAENFLIHYRLKDTSEIKAGMYRTQIKYLIEGPQSGSLRLLDTYNLEVEIPSVFDLIVKTPTGGNVIEFRNLKPKEPPRRFEVEFLVNTNLGKPYQVSQNLVSELTNREGKTIPLKFFTLKTEDIKSKGKLQFPNTSEVKLGEMVLYISDKEGLPCHFKVIYELSSSWEISAGDYSAPIVYSITEI